MSNELEQFVYRGLREGLARDKIVTILRQAGWPEGEVEQVLAGYADVDSPVPVPRPRGYVSAADTVLQLGVFVSLYVWIGTWLWLLFTFVGMAYPDTAATAASWQLEAVYAALRRAVATLVIAYPLYLWLSRRVVRLWQANPQQRSSRVRSWLLWLTLFVAAAALLGDLATLIYRFLDGDLTVRFLLKAAIVGVLAAGLLVHYRAGLQIVGHSQFLRSVRWLGPVTTVGLLISIGVAIWFAGSPATARLHGSDQQRLRDLRALSHRVDQYWQQHDSLPGSLAVLAARRGNRHLEIRDPVSAAVYGYTVVGDRTYQLCAVFATASSDAVKRFWRHPHGQHCFTLQAQARS